MADRTARWRPGSRRVWNETVRRGWNQVSYRYRPRRTSSDCFGHLAKEYRGWLAPIGRSLPRGAAVLELGSGTGVPTARLLSRSFRVTGVDISDRQVRRARRLVPAARFLRADLSEVDFPARTFAAVVALYSFIHVPRQDHARLFRRVARWLAPGGWFLVTLGHSRYEGREARWLGTHATMLWSHYDAATYRRRLREAGFRIVRQEFVPEDDGGHELFWARVPGSLARRRPIARRPADGSGRRAPALPRRTRARRPRGGPGRPPFRSP